MTFWGPILLLAVGVILSIALHEVGHLVPAKRFGVRCTQYMIGFGPTLFSRRFGDTEYGVKAFPLGGYVRMLGMFPPADALGPARPRRAREGRVTLADQAREESARGIGPEDAQSLFFQRSVPRRLVIMLGGPVMNLVIAAVLTGIMVLGTGIPQDSPRVGAVSTCVPATATATCDASAGSPAQKAGLRAGDVVISWNGEAVSSFTRLAALIRASGARTSTAVVERDGDRVTLSVTPVVVTRQKLAADGTGAVDASGQAVTAQVGAIGVSPATVYGAGSPSLVPQLIWAQAIGVVDLVWQIPAKLYGVVHSLVTGAPRDPTGPVSLIGVGRIATELSADSAVVGDGGARGWWTNQLSLLASLNMALFVFNLVPLLPLDGGHVAGALWEGFRRRVARWRGRPDPGPVDIARALPLAYGVASVLIAMTVLLMYADIVKPVSLTG